MSGLTALVVAFFLAWGPNEAPLHARVESSDALELRLVPWRELLAAASPQWISVEPMPTLQGFGWHAFYFEADLDRRSPDSMARELRAASPFTSSGIWLSPERYVMPRQGADAGNRWGWRMVVLETLAIDEVEPLLRTLTEAALDRQLGSEAPLNASFEARASALFSELDEEQRSAAYSSALVDYGSAVWGIAHEIGRLERRRRGRGESLCGLLGLPASLFGHWRRTVSEAPFPGHFPASTAGDRGAISAPRFRLTRAVLTRADKAWLESAVFGRQITGDPKLDFAFLCDDPN